MSEKNEIILQASHLVKRFPAAGGRTLTACNDVSLSVRRRRTLGIVGESGCGKSTLVRMLLRMETPTAGEVLFHGTDVLSLRGEALRQYRRHVQMVFQDPLASFHPKMKVIDILTEPLRNFGLLGRGQKERKARELMHLVGLPDELLYRYPHSMSGGQRQRIGIARALALEPEVLVCDEATSALDVSIQRSIIELLVRLQRETGVAIVFICHDIALIRSFAHEIAVMYLGDVVEVLPGEALSAQAAHPYTRALLAAQFSIHTEPGQPIGSVTGEAPSPLALPAGCPFQTRCPEAAERCRAEKPPLAALAPQHEAACWRLDSPTAAYSQLPEQERTPSWN